MKSGHDWRLHPECPAADHCGVVTSLSLSEDGLRLASGARAAYRGTSLIRNSDICTYIYMCVLMSE
jgi:hypothetical protein